MKGTQVRAGRKRDPARDAVILDAALAVLAELGYDRMTVDMVAERAGMARATVYRRWPTKTDLVLDTVSRLSAGDVERDRLPDTGTLRGDLFAMIRPFDGQDQQIRVQAMLALLAVAKTDERMAETAQRSGLGPWIDVIRRLLERAVDRGEFPTPDDLGALAEVVPMLCLARAAQGLPITAEWSRTVIDGVIIPALRGGPSPTGTHPKSDQNSDQNRIRS